MSSSSKRRKVTVDIKQTKLERGSVFARLGNKDKHRKKNKGDSDSASKPKKDAINSDTEADEVKKKTKPRSDEVTVTKKIKEYSSSSKPKGHEYEQRESRKSHRRSEDRYPPDNEESQSIRSKRKSEKKIENLIIEKRMSPVLVVSEEPSHSRSPSSLSPKKKSKKHKVSSQYDNKQIDHSPSPERSELRKHKERGRSREKKKSAKDTRKSKETIDPIEIDSQGLRHSSKSKKAAKHKPDKYHSEDIMTTDKKPSKIKSYRDQLKDHEKSHGKISPVMYDASSDEKQARRHDKDIVRTSKSKRQRQVTSSQSVSPARHKKSKRHVDADEESRKDSSASRSHSLKKRNQKDDDTLKKKSHKEDSTQMYGDFSPMSKLSQAEYSEMSQTSAANDDMYSSDAITEKESKRRSKTKKKAKKEPDSSSKPHYEVIDDDYSDDSKRDKRDNTDKSRRGKRDYGDDGKKEKRDYNDEIIREEREYGDDGRKEKRDYSGDVKKEKRDYGDVSKREKRDFIDGGKRDKGDHGDDGKREKNDYSDDGKRDKKKRKRKRHDDESPDKSHRYDNKAQNIPVKKSSHLSPPEKVRHTEKYLSPHDGEGTSFKRKSSPHIANRHDSRIDISREVVKQDRKEHHEKYRELNKGFGRDVRDQRRESYDEIKSSRDMIFSPERREAGFVHNRPPDRHFSAERNNKKIGEWHQGSAKRMSGDRSDTIPRLMSMPHDQECRVEGSRSSVNTYPVHRKRSDQEYQDHYQDGHKRSGSINSERNIRTNDRRLPPPLLPPTFDRSCNPSNSREKHGYIDNTHFGNNVRKFEKTHRRDIPPQSDVRDRKHLPVHDDFSDRLSRSSSHDSRSSHHHAPLSRQGKNRNPVDAISPQTDRNLSHERKDSRKVLMDGPKYTKERQYGEKHSRSRERTIKVIKSDEGGDKGRPGDHVRPLKRHRDESSGSRRSSPSQDHKKRRSDAREDKSQLSQRPKKEVTKSPTKESDKKYRTERKSSRKSDDHSKAKTDAKKPATTESRAPEVDWNELPSTPKGQTVRKEKSQVLSKFTPGSILQQTGIIMSTLPEHLINRINKTNSTKQKESSENHYSSVIGTILQNGLNSYSDEKLRKHLLGYDIKNRHEYHPPSIINGKTYAAFMKLYMRKSRLVEPL